MIIATSGKHQVEMTLHRLITVGNSSRQWTCFSGPNDTVMVVINWEHKTIG